MSVSHRDMALLLCKKLGGDAYMSERYGVVYKITNVINNKVYIGVTTKTFRERYGGNLAKTTHNKHLKNSIKKYGIENFVINEEFDVAYSVEELNEKEQYYIKKYDAMSPNKGYNKVSGGVIGYQYSEQTKLKMSEANTRKKTVYQYMLNGNYIGEYTSLTSVRDIGYCHKSVNDCCLGRHKTAYGCYWSYEKLSKEQVIKRVTANTRTNTIAVYQYTKSGEFVRRFSSIQDVGREIGLFPQNISKVCSGKRKHCGGYKWSYIPLHKEVV